MLRNNSEKIRRYILPAMCFLIVPLLFYAKYYFSNMALGDADLIQYFSAKKCLSESLIAGTGIQWNQYIAGGMPQAGVSDLYLISTLLSFLPLKQYMYLYFIFHLFMGAYFFYLYLIESKCNISVAFIMAIIYECSIQINGTRKGHPTIVAAICLFPVIMYLIKKFFNTKESKWLYLSAIVSAMQATIVVQYSTYADLILVVYLILIGINQKFKVSEILIKGIKWIFVYVGTYAYALLPTLSIMSEYSSYGSSSTSYAVFTDWSLHPIKALQMIFPKIFGNIYQAFGNKYSSEMDIEIYLGIAVLLLAVVCIVVAFKKFEVKVELLCAILAFLYSAIAYIPFLNQLVYHIPVLGGYRCAARMLYIFYFFIFSIAARGMSEIITENNISIININVFQKIVKKFFSFLVLTSFIVIFTISVLFVTDDQLQYYYKLWDTIVIAVIVSCVLMVLLIIVKQEKFSVRMRQWIFLLGIMGITLYETLPYSLATNAESFSSILSSNEIDGTLKRDSNYKVWDVFEGVSGAHYSIISQNKSSIKKINAINSYTSFNNPLQCKYFDNLNNGSTEVPFNFSGLLTGSLNAEDNILFQNDLLSMLGIKYLIDSSGVIEKNNGMTYDLSHDGEPIIYKENLQIDLNGSIGVGVLMQGIEENTQYKIEFTVREEDNDGLTFLAVDLYGGPEYDEASKETDFTIIQGQNSYTAYLYSGNTDAASQEILVRILAIGEKNSIIIEKCSISVIAPQKVYEYWVTDEYGKKIFINANANSILYNPEQVIGIDSFDNLYTEKNNYRLDKDAYILNESASMNISDMDINNINFSGDILTADIKCTGNSYLCFSQNYSSKWKVFVDGKEQKVDMVNGIIMGTYIAEGEHEVKFQYMDYSYLIGMLITIITIICVIFGKKIVGFLFYYVKRNK